MNKIYEIKGFTPFIIVAFLDIFIDIGHKVLMLNILYQSLSPDKHMLYTSLMNILIILPFVLFFSPSGFLSDKFPKNSIIKFGAFSNIFLFLVCAFFYFIGFFWGAFYMILLVTLQTVVYSPAKYGYIKELVGKENLTWGNGVVQATAIGAIVGSIIIFSALFERFYSNTTNNANEIIQELFFLSLLFCIFAVLEFVLSFRLPTLKEKTQASFDRAKYFNGKFTKENFQIIKKHKMIYFPIIFIAVFWVIAQLIVSIFPVYANNVLQITEVNYVHTIVLCAGIGLIIGSVIAGRYSKNYIETGLIPIGAFLMFISILSITFFQSLVTLSVLFFLFGLGGGLYTVPLHALMQFYAEDKELGIVLAGNNFVQNVGMLLALLLATTFGLNHLRPELLLYLSAILGCVAMFYMMKLIPFSLVRALISMAVLQRYKLVVEGFNNIPQKGGVLLLGNHISFIDWAIVQMAVPKKVYFIMERNIHSRWYIRMFLDFLKVTSTSDLHNPNIIRQIQTKLSEGNVVCLFPEGVISRHGHLNEFRIKFDSIAQNIDSNQAVILPFYIRGMWGSIFSRSHEEFRERKKSFTKRNVSIAFGLPLPLHTQSDKVKAKIFEMSFKAWEHQCKNAQTLPGAFIEACKRGGSDIAIIDTQTGSISYRRLLTLCVMISQDMKEMEFKELPEKKSSCSLPNDCIGIMLPSSLASIICNFSALIAGKIVVNLNFTAGHKAIKAAMRASNLSHVYTSRKFLQKLQEKGIEIDFGDIELHFMEDIVGQIKKQKLAFIVNMLFVSLAPNWLLKLLFAKESNIDSVCAILFSSGSEGIPKGVMLSHLNIMSNVTQLADVLHGKNDEIILSSLPPFHAFGFTATTLMPLLENILIVSHPDPTDALGVAKAIAQNKVTIIGATSTILGIYARNSKIDKVMFDSIRFTIAGAEKLKKEIREAYTMKFNKPIYEGYGATETTPVASVNLPDEFDVTSWQIHRGTKEGSVGMPLPGTAIRIVDPETLEVLPTGEHGLILIGGHQIMVGYLNNEEKTDEVIVNLQGIRWYKSGDKGYLDCDGFLHITDRYSRFAKIGGEMISLTNVEEEIDKVLKIKEISEFTKVCAVSLEDSKKGEKIILLIESQEEFCKEAIEAIKKSDIIPIKKPSEYFIVDRIPVLGSGKIDLKNAKELAKEIEKQKTYSTSL